MNNEYKTVCDTCYQKTWYETEQPCKQTIFKGCPTCGSHEKIDKPTQCKGTLRVIDYSDLDERLTPYYKSGERVKITYKDGSIARGTIGKSTGWKPIYLIIKTTRSLSGEGVLNNFIKNIQAV